MARLSTAVVFVAALIWTQPAQAQLRQTYPASAAIEGGVSVTVWPGSGTNIDFSGLGESVYRIWLDDPSRITVDTDNDLLDGGGAQVIHLRRIEGVDFAGLPTTAQTLLTVATVNRARQTTLYQFPVFYSTGTPAYSTIALTLPPASRAPAPRIQLAAAPLGGASLETLQLGLAALIREGTIAADGPLVERVKTFKSLVRNGETPVEAAGTAGVNMRVIETLAARGLVEEAATRDDRLLELTEPDAVPSIVMPEVDEDAPEAIPFPFDLNEAVPPKLNEEIPQLFDMNPADILPDGDVLRLEP